MGDLDKWNDDRLVATLALAERIAGDMAALVAGLRGDEPKPQPKFPVPTWAEMGKHKTRRILISIGDSRVDVYHDDTQKSSYSGSREEDWTACDDPRVALTAALAKEGGQ